MRLLAYLVLALAAFLAQTPSAIVNAQAGSAWRDGSPHRVRFVAVDSAVRLEVLDWGGVGQPLLFVGCYLTAHVYDNIAPKLTDQFHVYAVTRRGVGASDRPSSGYGAQRRADDILAVMTAFDLKKPILVGNSCGGDVLHTLGARNPERIGGLMYLDAAEDPTLPMAAYGATPVDTTHMPACTGKPDAVRLPEAEIRQRPIDPDIRRAIVEENRVRPDYAHIRVPVVAIFRTVTKEQALGQCPPTTEQERQALIQAHLAGRAMLTKWQSDLRASIPLARIVELPGANLYMFISNRADIIRELRAFAASLRWGSAKQLGSARGWRTLGHAHHLDILRHRDSDVLQGACAAPLSRRVPRPTGYLRLLRPVAGGQREVGHRAPADPRMGDCSSFAT
jgi:pimeloyl-ACP methyl ester carboxylesterase